MTIYAQMALVFLPRTLLDAHVALSSGWAGTRQQLPSRRWLSTDREDKRKRESVPVDLFGSRGRLEFEGERQCFRRVQVYAILLGVFSPLSAFGKKHLLNSCPVPSALGVLAIIFILSSNDMTVIIIHICRVPCS